MSFETSLARLEEIIAALEGRDVPLDRALALFEEGITRLREATSELARAEAAVKVLRERADGVLDSTPLDG